MEQFGVIFYFQVFLSIGLLWLMHESATGVESAICQVPNLNRLASFLQTNVRCGDLNLDEERLICEVDNAEDWIPMMCSMMSSTMSCELPEGLTSCPDGSHNMTCLPLDGRSGGYYRCGCHAVLEEGATSSGEWAEWQMVNGELCQRTFYEGNVSTCITEIRSINDEVITLSANCDESLRVYVDGVRATSLNGNENYYWEASEYNINGCAKLLAMSCENTVGYGGLMASTSTGVKTDPSWRCTDVLETGWQMIGFTETEDVWGEPTTWENFDFPEISAQELWFGQGSQKTIYCRKFL